MTPGYHIAVSLMISGILYTLFRSWGMALSSLLSGILIDLDHVIDYLIEYDTRFNLKRFFYFCLQEKTRHKCYFVLHGWEWLFLWGAIGWAADWPLWSIGLLIGYGHHMILDATGNKPSRWGYLLIWRWKKNFDFKATFPGSGVSSRDI
jgi:hypothetical protein